MQPQLLQIEGETFVSLRDPAGIQSEVLLVSPLAYHLTQLMDGQSTRAEILAQARQRWGVELAPQQLQQLLNSLEERLVLDNATSRGYLRDLPTRPAAHAGGAYPEDPAELHQFLDDLLGRPATMATRGGQAYCIPHIDLKRGQESYAAAWNHLKPRLAEFDLFVVLGISHAFSQNPFILTSKHFETPLGRLETDQKIVEQLAAGLPFDPFLDEFNHLGEHSVEFQLVFLQHLCHHPYRILPILCGSFQDCLEEPSWPEENPHIATFLARLEASLARRPRTCWIASVDLAHLGQRFGGPALSPESLARLGERDRQTMECAAAGDARAFLATLQSDKGQRNYCGTSAIYSMLQVLKPGPGSLLHYQQCNEPRLTSTVTVASLSFPGPSGSAS